MLRSTPALADSSSDELQAKIFLRALAYDRTLKSRAVDGVNIAIVYRSDDATSVAEKEGMDAALQTLSKLRLQGLPIRVFTVEFVNDEGFQAKLEAAAITVLFLTSNLKTMLPKVIAKSVSAKLITATGDPTQVRAGVALGIIVTNHVPKITVNKRAANAAGMEIAAELLRIAEIID